MAPAREPPVQRLDLRPQFPALFGPDGRPLPAELRGRDLWTTDPGRLFPPGEPIKPRMDEGAPRAFQILLGQNVVTTPRTWAGRMLTPFEQLRSLAEFDLVRIAIEDVKGQVLGMEWEVKVREEFKAQTAALEPKRQAAKRWLKMPDPLAGLEFRPWLTKVLEDVLTIDALTLFPRYTRGGEFIGLEQTDGATILPLVDERGRPPMPPEPAYAQIIYGTPETQFRAGELWYLPRNQRTNSPYGRSPVEYVLMAVNLAIRQQLYELQYYTSGSIPDAIYTLPESWGLQEIKEIQEWVDLVLSGRLDRRAGGMRFLPGGQGAAFHEVKTRLWQYEYMEWLGRVIAWAFGVSSVPITKQMNRATAEQMEQSMMESGVKPIAEHVRIPINRAIQSLLGAPELEFCWGEEETADEATIYLRDVAHVVGGIRSVDEVRREKGWAPYGIDEPFVMVGGTPVFLRRALEQEHAPPPARSLPNPEPAPAPGPEASAPEHADQEREELRQWTRSALKRAKEGRLQRAFHAAYVPVVKALRLRRALNGRLSPEAVRAAFAKAEATVAGTADLEARLRDLVAAWIADRLPEVRAWALARLGEATASKVAKQDEPPLDLSGLWAEIVEILDEAVRVGASDSIADLGIDLTTPDEEALQYARDRAAELVGRRWDGEKLIDNPNPRWAITETMRADVNAKVTQAVAEGWSPQRLSSELDASLGDWRARTIARTETGYAYNHGAAEAYDEAGIETLQILDGSGCLPEGHDDAAPAATGTPGLLEPTHEANGQIWTLQMFRDHPLGHPNCTRAAVAASGEAQRAMEAA